MIDQLRAELPEAQVQADWAEGDASSKSYIKNRTHYDLYNTVDRVTGTKFKATPTEGSSAVVYANKEDIPEYMRAFIVDRDTGELLEDLGYIYIDKDTLVSKYDMSANVLLDVDNDNYYLKIVINYRSASGGWLFRTDKQAKNSAYIDNIVYFGTYNRVTKTLSPYFLAPNPVPGSILAIDDGSNMQWVNAPTLIAPNGTKYRLVVDNSGVLSTVPVTN